MMLQIHPALPVDACYGVAWERSGPGHAHAWIDYSQDHNLLWLVADDASGEFWLVPNHLVRAVPNASLGVRGTKQEATNG